jgi:uncharacterized protein
MLRLAYFPESGQTLVGLMCCSPEREGFEVEFSELQIGEPIRTGLHDYARIFAKGSSYRR